MKKFFCTFSLLLFLVSLSLSLAAGEKQTHILAWEATRKDLPGHLTLAGSVHLGKKDFYPLDSAYDPFWEKAHVLVLEVTDSDPKMIAPFLRQYAFYGRNRGDLALTCGPFLYQRLLFFCRSYYPPHLFREEEFRKKRPWFLTLELSQHRLSRLHYKLEYGVEHTFRRKAGKRELRGLEKTLFQLSTLEKIPEKEYINALEKLLNDPNKELAELEEMIRGWKTGSLAPLEKLVLRQKQESPILHKKLLLERNRDMAEKLASFAKEKKRFFVLIGSAHFAGNDSILVHLRKKGFTVKQIPSAGKKGKIAP